MKMLVGSVSVLFFFFFCENLHFFFLPGGHEDL